METLYLIAHKVRGEPAFDIAIRLQIGNEEGWIIPTSGHRAYPYLSFPINKFYLQALNSPIPENLPDHYAINAPPKAARRLMPRTPPTLDSLLEF